MNIDALKEKIVSKDVAVRRIRQALVAGIVNGTIVLAIGIADLVGYTNYVSDVTIFLEAAIIYGLSFGVFRRNRIAAVILFFYSIASNIVLWRSLEGYVGGFEYLFHALVFFAFFYFIGIKATFAYHKLDDEERKLKSL